MIGTNDVRKCMTDLDFKEIDSVYCDLNNAVEVINANIKTREMIDSKKEIRFLQGAVDGIDDAAGQIIRGLVKGFSRDGGQRLFNEAREASFRLEESMREGSLSESTKNHLSMLMNMTDPLARKANDLRVELITKCLIEMGL